MKQRILDDIDIFLKITVDSYFIPNGINYQELAKDVSERMDIGLDSGLITKEEHVEIMDKLDVAVKHVFNMKMLSDKKRSELEQLN